MAARAAPPAGSLADRLSRPHRFGVAAAIALLGAVPLLDAWAPIGRYIVVLYWCFAGPLLVLGLVARIAAFSGLSLRYTHRGWTEAPGWLAGVLVAAVLGAAGMLGAPMWLGFLVSYPALERARVALETGGAWTDTRQIGIYRCYAGDRPFGDGIVAIYTDGWGLFGWPSADDGRLPDSGDGFYYLPDGAAMQPYNTDMEGPLLYGWHWFSTE